MRIWLTRGALTKRGIISVEAAEPRTPDEKIAYFKKQDGFVLGYARPEDWHKTKKAAIKHAEKMRAQRIAELTRQIEKLTALEFKE